MEAVRVSPRLESTVQETPPVLELIAAGRSKLPRKGCGL
jgi:hypothetical protein